MKIAYTIFSSQISGAEKRVIKLGLSTWFKHPFENNLILNKDLYYSALKDKELSDLIVKNKRKIIVVSEWITKKRIPLLLYLIFLKIKLRIDFFHCYLGARNIGMLLGVIGIKNIYELTSPDVADTFIENYSNRKFFYNKIYRINCVSPSVFNRLKSKLKAKKYDLKSKVVFNDIPYTKIFLESKIDITSKENIIIYPNRFIARKNVILFAEVAKEILKNNKDWTIKIFGNGELEMDIKNILALEIEEGRAFVGYTNNIIEEFRKSKIVCSYIEPDNYPSQSLFEALACSNALIVSDTGNSNIFVKNHNGILADSSFLVNNYVQDIESLINDESLLKAMQNRSEEYYYKTFSEENYFNQLVNNCYQL